MNKLFAIDNRPVTISLIVAMAENRVIGRDNKLLWHIPEDLANFKAVTMGKPLIMGRKTFESLPGILPGRPHVILTRTPPENPGSDLHYATSVEDGLKLAYNIARNIGVDEIFIIGGAEIYKEALERSYIDKIYLTRVHEPFIGDAYFPVLDKSYWKTVSKKDFDGELPFTFETLIAN